MRIAMLTWESVHSIFVGGVGAHVSELAAALADQGHDVHVFTRRGSGQGVSDHIDGVCYHRCAYASHPDFIEDVNNMCRAFVEAVYLVEGVLGPFDIIHAHDWLAANAMVWLKQGSNRRCVLTIHSTEYARCGNAIVDGQSLWVRGIERSGTYWADRVIAVSDATRHELKWMYELPDGKAHVIHNGINPLKLLPDADKPPRRVAWGLDRQQKVVLFCGRLAWQKGPDLLVEAMPSIVRHDPRVMVVFAGDGHMRSDLEHRTRQLNMHKHVRFCGFVRGRSLVELFQLADMVVVPSRNEPFGIVVLEAWSAGRPVVVTHIGGPGEYVEHERTGLKIYPHADSVTWGITTMLQDARRAARMARNGRAQVHAHFTWDRIARQTIGVYHDIMPPTPRPVRRRTHTGPMRKFEPVAV